MPGSRQERRGYQDPRRYPLEPRGGRHNECLPTVAYACVISCLLRVHKPESTCKCQLRTNAIIRRKPIHKNC
ncbi:hypothetical protein BD309DRAFT_653079 [Dichomitus squalens]|uniref:Uncharacterized protein n=1 Tax=Dichomitus squalens TaxID=114155 RepID=A0A4Q9NDC2_9APHY|nr:hypothetical protein BD309DRAFT_653079 [Dichomitus squalens]TBU62816.1 hypothetical protein BD310DRAFT_704325 [Dichomitus squalens]